MSSNAICSKASYPLSVKGTVSAHLKVAGGIWKACTQNHSKSLGCFLIVLSCPASAILNANSGLFSIFKPSQQQGIVFPVNIAFWLFIYTLANHTMARGRGSSSIAPRSMVSDCSCLQREGQTLYLGCVLLSASCWLSCVCWQGGEGKGCKSHSTQEAGKQHSSLFFPCTSGTREGSLGKPWSSVLSEGISF